MGLASLSATLQVIENELTNRDFDRKSQVFILHSAVGGVKGMMIQGTLNQCNAQKF